MKRIIAVLLCLVLTAGAVLSVTALETDNRKLYNNNEYIYEISEDNTVAICYYLGNGGKVTVPAYIDGQPVKTIGEYAFYGTDITDLVVSEGVECIEDEAFFYCTSLMTAQLPDSLESVGAGVFRDCMNLEIVNFAGDNSALGNYMFYGCTRLKEVELPRNIKTIPKGAFSYCKDLESIYLPEGLQVISDYGFYHSGLVGVALYYDVNEIGKLAFAYCTELQEVYVFGDRKIENVAYDAFCGAGTSVGGSDYNEGTLPTPDEPNRPPSVDNTDSPDWTEPPYVSGDEDDGYYMGTTQEMAEYESGEIIRTNNFVREDKKELLKLAWNVRMVGDSNRDNKVNIKDATNIQCYLAKLIDENTEDFDYKNSDVDMDGQVTVRDATAIQKFVAGITDSL